MKQDLVLQCKFPSLNELIGAASANRFVYGSLKKKMTAFVATECKIQKLKPMDGKIKVSFDWVEGNKRRDFDNVSGAGQKLICDGLKQAGIIVDDSHKFVAQIAHSFRHDAYHGVIVTLENI